MSTPTLQPTRQPLPTRTRLNYLAGVRTVFALEMRQRLRSRGWYIMLGIWVVVVLLVTLGVGMSLRASAAELDVGIGQLEFELTLSFVLLFGALIAPVFAANSVSGDRAGGTLAILQATLVTPGQILWGKWLAAWVASLAFLVAALPSLAAASTAGQLLWGSCLAMLLVVALELAVLCGIGVGISAWTSRPLFSILATYLVVAALGLGTVMAAGVAAITVTTTVQASDMRPTSEALAADAEWQAKVDKDPDLAQTLPYPEAAQKLECSTASYSYETADTTRFTWLLAANPFAVLADLAAPALHGKTMSQDTGTSELPNSGILAYLRAELRSMQAGPQAAVPCLNGTMQKSPDLSQQAPLWPLGLGVQGLLTAALVFAGWRRLRTPAGQLPQGTRVA